MPTLSSAVVTAAEALRAANSSSFVPQLCLPCNGARIYSVTVQFAGREASAGFHIKRAILQR